MSRNPMQKQKLLYLRKILLEKTDENHGLTSSEILAELALYGITAERKSLYDDLQVLEKFGMDICKSKSSTVKYYVASREFELPELKLLVDAIQSSKFITEKKSISLIHKLEGLASVHDGKELQRQVFVANRAKTMNERIYYSVDKIQNAIALNRKSRLNITVGNSIFRERSELSSVKKSGTADTRHHRGRCAGMMRITISLPMTPVPTV